MIKPTKGLSPVYVHFYDGAAASIYNLTKQQFDLIMESQEGQSKGVEATEMFEVELEYEFGYIPDYVATLSTIYGFEVDSE